MAFIRITIAYNCHMEQRALKDGQSPWLRLNVLHQGPICGKENWTPKYGEASANVSKQRLDTKPITSAGKRHNWLCRPPVSMAGNKSDKSRS